MCGRFSLTANEESFAQRFGIDENLLYDYRPRFNIAPQQKAPVIVSRTGVKEKEMMRWGLVPFWAKDVSIGNRLINARAETIAEKPSFKHSLKRRRCLVPADGFYEWQKDSGKKKTPVRITLNSGGLFAFAGLYDEWKSEEGEKLITFTIITTEPNDLIKPIHHRMPVILKEEDEEKWLNPEAQEVERMVALLKPYPAEEMKLYAVSDLVNSPANDVPECVFPL